jgi:hypothetical protein
MALYHTIYAPDGVPFEVSPERASELILNQGWSNTPPQKDITVKTGKKTRQADTDSVPAVDTSEAERPVHEDEVDI